MIIATTEILRQHLAVNGSITIDNLQPYLKQAERKYLKPLISAAQLTVFEAVQTDPILREAQSLAREAVANFGYFLYLPINAVQVSDNGIHVVSNENTKAATDKQFKDLQRSFIRAGNEALDELLTYMEENANNFTPWTSSSAYTVYRELLVKDTATFNNYYHIFNSRQTFIAMKANIKIVEDQFIKTATSPELVEALKANQTVEERIDVKKYLQQAIVAFTVMKTVYNGLFVLDASGIHVRFDSLPYETASSLSHTASSFLKNTEKDKKIEGEEYLKAALKIINANPTLFPEITEKTNTFSLGTTNTRSIFGM